mgnify:CR=1 FL=1
MTDAQGREIAIMAPRPGSAASFPGGALPMNSPFSFRLAIAAVIVASLALAGCGRKGPLEAPGAAATQVDGQAEAPADAPKKPDRHFILDPLVQ